MTDVTDLFPELLLKYINTKEIKRALATSEKTTEALESFIELCRESTNVKLGKFCEFETDDGSYEGFIGVIKLQYEELEGVSYQYLAIFHNPSPICIKGFYDAFYRKYVEDLRHFPAYYYVLMGNNNTAKDGIISLSNEKLYKWHKKLFPKRELIYIMPYWAQLSPVFNRIKESLNIPELSDEKKLVYENKMLRWAMCSSKLMGSGLVGLSSDKSYIYPSNIFDYEGLAYWCKRALEYVDYVSENVKWDSFIDVIRTRDDKNASFKKKQLTMALSCAETGHKIKRKKYFNDIENCFKDD